MLTEADILSDPSASNWLKQAIRDLKQRDPVDALNDVEFLLDFLKRKEISSYNWARDHEINHQLAKTQAVLDSNKGAKDLSNDDWIICHECGGIVTLDDAVWIDPESRKATMDGEPFHTFCAPPQHPNDCDCDYNNCRCDNKK